jgi:hypothetical protein
MSNGSESFVVVLDKLSEVAFRYGPSFFALLFLLFLVRTASQEYQKVLCRADPAPQSAEKGVYAGLLISSWLAGITLVAVSVWFFLFTHQVKHTFEAMIVDLHPTAVISMDNGYTKRMIRPIEGARPFQDYYIAILRDRPFRKGERFSLRYIPELKDSGSGSPPTWNTVVLEIDSIDRGIAHFKIADDSGKFQLVRLQ